MIGDTLKLVMRSYDHRLLDLWAGKVLTMARDKEIHVSGPIPFPVKKKIFTVCRSVHTDKDSREQFELRIHKRLLVFKDFNLEDIREVFSLTFPNGIQVKVDQ